jgi:hypothetical protein
MTISKHMKWRDRWGWGEGPIESLQKRHHFITWWNIL